MNLYFCRPKNWRVVRVVEGARLESVYTRKGIKSSNLLLSARNFKSSVTEDFLFYINTGS